VRRELITLRRTSLGLLAAALAVVGIWGCGASVLPEVHSEQERLATARRLAGSGDYGTAAEMLKTYVDRNAGASDEDGAIYLLGECYLNMREWASAQLEFERLLRDYPESDSAGSASFRLGEALFGQSKMEDFDQEYTQKALIQWQDYLAAYPDHWRHAQGEKKVLEARMKLASKLLDNADLYVKLKLVEPARTYYQKILDEYGDLPLAGQAEIGLARCDLLYGRRDAAIDRLKRVESEHAGEPAAVVAKREREKAEHSRAHAPIRPPAKPIPAPPGS